jgi:hypothetical protein
LYSGVQLRGIAGMFGVGVIAIIQASGRFAMKRDVD